MTHPTLALLDQQELLQLALNAGGASDAGSAIGYLKEAVSRADATAQAHYLLGAEYAQIGLYERAIGEMEAAVALDPTLAVARLQLAMLWLGADNGARAAETLRPLEQLGQTEPLRHFGTGLLLLIGGEKAAAADSLREGIALNDANPALNGDMRNVIAHIEQGGAQAVAQDEARAAVQEAAPAAEEQSQHILLSAYTGGQRH